MEMHKHEITRVMALRPVEGLDQPWELFGDYHSLIESPCWMHYVDVIQGRSTRATVNAGLDRTSSTNVVHWCCIVVIATSLINHSFGFLRNYVTPFPDVSSKFGHRNWKVSLVNKSIVSK
jgi:hypothetical protein